MGSFLEVGTRRRRVALAGKVVDSVTGQALPGAVAAITAMPRSFERWLALRAQSSGAAWSSLVERPDRTLTAPDGCFRFTDLPDGTYSVSIAGPAGRRYGAAQASFTVARTPQGRNKVTVREIRLAPTGVRGRIQGPTSAADATLAPRPLARVRVQGSGEMTYSDEQGGFYLSDLEAGARVLAITAAGYAPLATPASIKEGKIANLGTLSLKLVAI